jgi:hypothetical protein
MGATKQFSIQRGRLFNMIIQQLEDHYGKKITPQVKAEMNAKAVVCDNSIHLCLLTNQNIQNGHVMFCICHMIK